MLPEITIPLRHGKTAIVTDHDIIVEGESVGNIAWSGWDGRNGYRVLLYSRCDGRLFSTLDDARQSVASLFSPIN